MIATATDPSTLTEMATWVPSGERLNASMSQPVVDDEVAVPRFEVDSLEPDELATFVGQEPDVALIRSERRAENPGFTLVFGEVPDRPVWWSSNQRSASRLVLARSTRARRSIEGHRQRRGGSGRFQPGVDLPGGKVDLDDVERAGVPRVRLHQGELSRSGHHARLMHRVRPVRDLTRMIERPIETQTCCRSSPPWSMPKTISPLP